MCIYVYVHTCMCICMCIHIGIERERDEPYYVCCLMCKVPVVIVVSSDVRLTLAPVL